jgi:hypothetical protein
MNQRTQAVGTRTPRKRKSNMNHAPRLSLIPPDLVAVGTTFFS